jgi:hypothetical protein
MRNLALLLLPISLFAQQNTPTTGAEKLAAFAKQKQMIQQSPYKNLQWRLVGPDIRSGRSTDVEVSPVIRILSMQHLQQVVYGKQKMQEIHGSQFLTKSDSIHRRYRFGSNR